MAKARERLRIGFSTGTAATAAARAALRHLLSGNAPRYVAVRLPVGIFLPVSINENRLILGGASASVIKDGGDDPDVTHKAEIRASVKFRFAGSNDNPSPSSFPKGAWKACEGAFSCGDRVGICLVAGEGLGVATKPGLPLGIGEPAINPVPRTMLAENLTEEILQAAWDESMLHRFSSAAADSEKPQVLVPWSRPAGCLNEAQLVVEICVPRGLELSRHTLNPRLGIIGGISILGTTGLVRPFSHEAYKETIQAELSVAASNGCKGIVLSTGGKSERFARNILKSWPEEAFVQIADFFAFSLQEARRRGFENLVLSVFFGKAVKMAQGHPYTHAHKVSLDLRPLVEVARKSGYPPSFCRSLENANTAREAVDLILARHAEDLIRTIARGVLEQTSRIVGNSMAVRLFLLNYDGSLLLDLESS